MSSFEFYMLEIVEASSWGRWGSIVDKLLGKFLSQNLHLTPLILFLNSDFVVLLSLGFKLGLCPTFGHKFLEL